MRSVTTSMLRVWLLIALCVTFAGGCSTHTGSDAWPRAPLIAGEPAASSKVVYTTNIMWRQSGKLTWVGPNGEKHSANRIARRLGPMLNEHGVHLQPSDEFAPYPHDFVENNPCVLPEASRFVSRTAVLVSVEPTVVVISDVPAATWYWSDGVNTFAAEVVAPELVNPNADENERSFVVGLPNGLLYGDVIPYADAMEVASPDPEIGSLPVSFDAAGEWRLPVTWGWLVLERQGDIVKVRAEHREARSLHQTNYE